MVDVAQVLERLRSETDTMVAETMRLAQIDSGSEDAEGVALVGELVGELFAATGCSVRARPAGGLRATLTVGAGPRLLVIGHADTVWPAGTVAGWPPRVDGDMLAGPGVGDMKSCLVMAAHALSAARAHDLAGIGEIELLVVADEELGSVGSRDWIESRARGTGACLGLEAGWPGGGVVAARGAVGALQLRALGRSAHCARDEGEGASAISALVPLVAAIESLSRPTDGLRISVGVFRSGVARQVVPDEAELLIDLRAPTAESADGLLDDVRETVRRADGPDVRLTLSGGITRPAFHRTTSDGLLSIARPRARQLGLPLRVVSSRGGSDASFAAALGVPTLDGLGPICHNSCSRAERIEISSLAGRAALLALLIVDLAESWRAQPDT
jgi:glutamate carboxypeptidase